MLQQRRTLTYAEFQTFTINPTIFHPLKLIFLIYKIEMFLLPNMNKVIFLCISYTKQHPYYF